MRLLCDAAWKILFDSLWKTFNTRFQGILQNLRSHRDLIDREANAFSIVQGKAWRDEQVNQMRQDRTKRDEEIQKIEQQNLAQQVRDAVAWLNASEDQEDLLVKLLKTYDSAEAHWALEESVMKRWLHQGQDSLVVWLNGKPGTGRSQWENNCQAKIPLKVRVSYAQISSNISKVEMTVSSFTTSARTQGSSRNFLAKYCVI